MVTYIEVVRVITIVSGIDARSVPLAAHPVKIGRAYVTSTQPGWIVCVKDKT